jgi:AraC-like DNA-binding protein
LVITFINKHHMETLTLSDVASKVGMRPDTFSRWFRKQAGETFRNYLISIRLQQIAHTLKTQKMTIMETAFQHGFSNLANFNRLFLQHYGVSPKVYRNQVQQRTSAISLTEKEPSQPIQLSTTSKLTISKEMQEALDASTEVDP